MGTFIVGSLLGVTVCTITYKLIKNSKNGGCCGDCSQCNGCKK